MGGISAPWAKRAQLIRAQAVADCRSACFGTTVM
jgi:hypothetical protein